MIKTIGLGAKGIGSLEDMAIIALNLTYSVSRLLQKIIQFAGTCSLEFILFS